MGAGKPSLTQCSLIFLPYFRPFEISAQMTQSIQSFYMPTWNKKRWKTVADMERKYGERPEKAVC